MLRSIGAAAALSLLPWSTLAADTASTPEGVISLPLHRILNQSAYGTDLSLGTPPQKVVLLVDTGSPTYSAHSPENPICKEGLCEVSGVYNNLTSSTADYISDGFNNILINHGMGSYINDTVTVGDKSFSSMKFGVIENYSASFPLTTQLVPILGLGASCYTKACDSYPTLLQELYDRGEVASRTVSGYLGPDSANATGEILLGGYDAAKRRGTIYKRQVLDPTVPEANSQPNFVPVSSMRLTKGKEVAANHTFASGTHALWDTGSPRWYVPNNVFNSVAERFSIPKNATASGFYEVDCANLEPTGDTMIANFGDDVEIAVPLHKLVTQLSEKHCRTYIAPGGEDSATFGDPFLRNVYFTFDYDKLTIEFSEVEYTDERDIIKLG